MDDAKGSVSEAEAQSAGLVEAVEGALLAAGGQEGAEGMSGGEPGGADRGEPLGPPAREPGGEAGGEALDKGFRGHRRIEAGRRAIETGGPVGEIDAEADDHRVVLALEQYAGELGAIDEQVVGPFDPRARLMAGDRLVERDGGEQGQSRRGRVAGLEADQGRGVEVAGRRDPRPALPPFAAGLPLGAQPEALLRAVPRERGDVVIGRAGLGDGADQKSACAAFAAAAPSQGMAR